MIKTPTISVAKVSRRAWKLLIKSKIPNRPSFGRTPPAFEAKIKARDCREYPWSGSIFCKSFKIVNKSIRFTNAIPIYEFIRIILILFGAFGCYSDYSNRSNIFCKFLIARCWSNLIVSGVLSMIRPISSGESSSINLRMITSCSKGFN